MLQVAGGIGRRLPERSSRSTQSLPRLSPLRGRKEKAAVTPSSSVQRLIRVVAGPGPRRRTEIMTGLNGNGGSTALLASHWFVEGGRRTDATTRGWGPPGHRFVG